MSRRTCSWCGSYRGVEAMSLGDLEAIRLILRGSSVIDWRRLHFADAPAVDHFLALNLFEPADPRDERRLRAVLEQAVEYLRKAFGYRVAEAVAQPDDLRELFLLASGSIEPRKYRRIACVVLKCMQVVHHLEARELLFRTPIREADLAERVNRRVMREARRMQQLGLPVVEFVGNVKARSSLITKLLAKRETVAAQIFDRVRYRVVTERQEQIPSILHHLTNTLFPFNYVVPGQSHNSLVRFREIPGPPPGGRPLRRRAAGAARHRGEGPAAEERLQRQELPRAQLRGGPAGARRRAAPGRRPARRRPGPGGLLAGRVPDGRRRHRPPQ